MDNNNIEANEGGKQLDDHETTQSTGINFFAYLLKLGEIHLVIKHL